MIFGIDPDTLRLYGQAELLLFLVGGFLVAHRGFYDPHMQAMASASVKTGIDASEFGVSGLVDTAHGTLAPSLTA